MTIDHLYTVLLGAAVPGGGQLHQRRPLAAAVIAASAVAAARSATAHRGVAIVAITALGVAEALLSPTRRDTP